MPSHFPSKLGLYTLLFIAAARLFLSKSNVRITWHIYVPGALLYLVSALVLIAIFLERPLNLFQSPFGNDHKSRECGVC